MDKDLDPEIAEGIKRGLERHARTDLCEECKEEEHATCSLDPFCACCQTTIEQMANEG